VPALKIDWEPHTAADEFHNTLEGGAEDLQTALLLVWGHNFCIPLT
jgi:hypothetical protein